MKIVRGVRQTAKRIVVHGVEGIGKSTLASQFPDAVILDTEDGTNHIDVARVRCDDWATLEGSMHELVRDAQGFRTVVIDSIDWAERHLIDHLLKTANKRSIEDFGFGKGYTMVAEAMGRLLTVADQLIDRGLNVALVGHTTVKRTSPPDLDEGYDRFELKLTKQSGPLVKEWADCILFANYRTKVVEGADGRMKARGGKERVLHTERAAAWDAKNRFGLPAELPMSIDSLAPLFERPRSWRERIAACHDVESLGAIGDAVDDAESAGKLTGEQADTLRDLIAVRHDEVHPAEAGT